MAAVPACRAAPASTEVAPAAGSGGKTETAAPYERAPWRLLPWAERDRLVLWVSHIVISHRDAQPDIVLRPLNWHPDAPPKRSRDEAEQLAARVAREAQENPSRFESLARQYSDDDVTRERGGSLGGIRASQLPDAYVDALAGIPPGEVSRLVVTSMGYHILLRRSPPPSGAVAGRRVVIRYEGTLGTVDEGAPARSREEARSIAEAVFSKARSGIAFGSLVDQYSEHGDRAFEGDMGVWSTLDPGDHPREVEALSRLEVSEVGRPLDTFWGFQVLERTAPQSRGRYAMAAIELATIPDVPGDDPRSPDRALTEARALAKALHKDPSAMPREQDEHHCPGVESWNFGHGSPELTAALDKLRFGEVAREPVKLAYRVVIPERLDPALTTPRDLPPSYELPARAAPDIARVFRDAESSQLLPHFSRLTGPEVAAGLRLQDKEAAALRSTLGALQKDLAEASAPDARVAAYERAVKALYNGMSEASYSRLMSFIQEVVARIALTGR
jgi:hypothetical protein